ncbi:hypothetical protein BU16DRAFT_224631 [Lophium mytilinum]|uniref:F-box domain-containing protein n=1 Tax=Lophium mytilinum TaxID=390894 RepID=A0A6A6Q8J9_9PEZI|nr:hypothetical protein BU16DRAFT_224631 [Lophium mytilinum]
MAQLSQPMSPELLPKSPRDPHALEIAELIERIASNLDVPDLIRFAQVCNQWKAVVDSSPTLRHWMWKCQLTRLKPPVEVQLPGSLWTIWPICFRGDLFTISRPMNPVLANFFTKSKKTPLLYQRDPEQPEIMRLNFDHDGKSPILCKGFQHKEASCRDMFISIPLLTQLSIGIYADETSAWDCVWAYATIRNSNGLRLGELLDAMRDIDELGALPEDGSCIKINKTTTA